MMQNWFSSDWHIGHHKIISLNSRPFKTVDEMDETIYHNMFARVRNGDNFYFLGDLTFRKSYAYHFFDHIKPKRVNFHWILGNHDKSLNAIKNFSSRCAFIGNLKAVTIMGQAMTLCHYPMVSWDKSHYGAWQLYGHHHSDFVRNKYELLGKQLNVCCDLHVYCPLSFDEVRWLMQSRSDNWDLISNKEKI